MSRLRHPALWVGLILWASYAFYWQGRDWNSASRLMLTYAVVDRGTVSLDGLDDQTHDIARYRGHWYTDKTPGFSVAAIPPYYLAKVALGLPSHPLGERGFPFWPADYWATLGTSGLGTAATATLLVAVALRLGCTPRSAALLGLAYGLATPAAVYATLAYGHQLAALGLFGSFAALVEPGRRPRLRACAAGFGAAYASVVEIQAGPASAVLGLGMIALVVARRRPGACLATFALGAAVPTLLLLAYNQLAFGAPWRMGYFYLVVEQFKEVHSASNPLGLGPVSLERVGDLLWGEFRGLPWFAPVVVLTPLGLALLVARRRWALAGLIGALLAAIFAVNLSYPEWTGGWTTGPRLLVPLLPFACVAVAPLLATRSRLAVALVAVLALAGGVEMFLYCGVGGRIPNFIARPFVDGVWPFWRGDPLPVWAYGRRFARTLADRWLADRGPTRPTASGLLTFAPLVAFQVVAIATLFRCLPAAPARPADQAGAT